MAQTAGRDRRSEGFGHELKSRNSYFDVRLKTCVRVTIGNCFGRRAKGPGGNKLFVVSKQTKNLLSKPFLSL